MHTHLHHQLCMHLSHHLQKKKKKALPLPSPFSPLKTLGGTL